MTALSPRPEPPRTLAPPAVHTFAVPTRSLTSGLLAAQAPRLSTGYGTRVLTATSPASVTRQPSALTVGPASPLPPGRRMSPTTALPRGAQVVQHAVGRAIRAAAQERPAVALASSASLPGASVSPTVHNPVGCRSCFDRGRDFAGRPCACPLGQKERIAALCYDTQQELSQVAAKSSGGSRAWATASAPSFISPRLSPRSLTGTSSSNTTAATRPLLTAAPTISAELETAPAEVETSVGSASRGVDDLQELAQAPEIIDPEQPPSPPLVACAAPAAADELPTVLLAPAEAPEILDPEPPAPPLVACAAPAAADELPTVLLAPAEAPLAALDVPTLAAADVEQPPVSLAPAPVPSSSGSCDAASPSQLLPPPPAWAQRSLAGVEGQRGAPVGDSSEQEALADLERKRRARREAELALKLHEHALDDDQGSSFPRPLAVMTEAEVARQREEELAVQQQQQQKQPGNGASDRSSTCCAFLFKRRSNKGSR
eukprot:TRINITY_DN24199_c0_g4_i1.p1 TRINITY_DN24199_c0_g4~~TRINITY_DN24199_c0_g4_i1.p1  ORF type:complete len:488 (+),score=111.17 TRINITY_DN24199_c0_g4_i1:134-1597(+)